MTQQGDEPERRQEEVRAVTGLEDSRARTRRGKPRLVAAYAATAAGGFSTARRPAPDSVNYGSVAVAESQHDQTSAVRKPRRS
jgi:hypothetical protein